MHVTVESRDALARARLFLEKAKVCPPDERVEFEAFLEATIVFARTAIHRLQTKSKKHPAWKAEWDSWIHQPAVQFFRKERDWILKEAPPKVAQKVFAATIGSNAPAFVPSAAAEFYYYDDPQTPATATLEAHLLALGRLLTEAERRFRP